MRPYVHSVERIDVTTIAASCVRRSTHKTATRRWYSAPVVQTCEDASQSPLQYYSLGLKHQFPGAYRFGKSTSQVDHAWSESRTSGVASNRDVSQSEGEEEPTKRVGQESDQKPERPGEISDQEWEIRTGRAIYILQQTLPEFFKTGLVSSLDYSARNGKDNNESESIYSSHIRLSYTPPTSLPPPFPRTLHVEGYPLYMGSSVFVRHTLNALYTDLHVELRRVRVHGSRAPQQNPPTPLTEGVIPESSTHRSTRQRSLFVGLSVSGVARVSGAAGGWEVNSTYEFSPVTGLIHLHTVDSIEPAPHQAVFDALRAALGKLSLANNLGREGVARGDCIKREGCQGAQAPDEHLCID